MATATALKALFETGDTLLESSFVALIDSVHPDVVTLGTFTGSTIDDAATTKEALQSLETALEAIGSGTDGQDGTDGDSAYEIAVGNGFVGSESDWLASLVGSDGEDGTNFATQIKTTDFDAEPGAIYLVSLAAGDVIATVPTTQGACSIVVTEGGETSGYGESGDPYTILAHCDSIGSGVTPNAVGGSVPAEGTSISGKFSNALRLQNGDEIQLAVDPDDDWTLDYWVRFNNGVDDDASVLTIWDGSGSIEFSVYGNGELEIGGTDVTASSGAIVPTADIWLHLAIVRDAAANTVDLYLDGTKVAYATVTAFTGTQTRITAGNSNSMDVDEIRWSRRKEWNANFIPPIEPYGYIGASSGVSTSTNKLTVAGTSIELSDAGGRVDIQCDGTHTVYQYVGHSMEVVDADATVATVIEKLVAGGLLASSSEE